ncbi:hypothetical protein RMATCC62417_11289 [Rhizopus microsporus]|nr:hypothetical protein RMATCC62417_11289 [Rhizopus microsporus]
MMSRADVLAETEAKLTRRLSEPVTKRATPTSRPASARLSTGSMSSLFDRKPLFTSHLPFSSVLPHIKSHVLVSGLLRVNRRNRSNAYVFSEELNSDIYICGSRDRNRALEGDYVAVKLVEVERVLMEKHEKEEAKLARNHGQPLIRKPDEEDEKEIIFGGEDDVEQIPPKYCGTVVAILDRAQNQVFSGTLGLTRPSHKKSDGPQQERRNSMNNPPRIIWFKPTDKRVPLIAIPVEQAPPGFVESPNLFEHRLFLSSIRRWPITSLHPFGVLERELGSVKDVEVQLDAIFADNNASTDVLSLDASLTDAFEDRLDLRHVPCFTIGKDKQNALSIEQMEETVKVGFHVADVTSLVELDSQLEKEARSRGIQMDGVLKQIPIWPDELRERVELTDNQDRGAFSVIWTFTEDGKIADTWFGRTMIHSSTMLTDKNVRDILDLDSIDEEGVETDILTLYSVACMLHSNRRHGLKRPQLVFHFEQGSTKPSQVEVSDHWQVLFEEFQILANKYVAQKIASHLPDQALLVSQPPHHARKLKELVNYLKELGYTLDSHAFEQSIDRMTPPEVQQVVRALLLKTFSTEKYFCTGVYDISRFYHHGLDVPLYTHFASPLTRYADALVHYQLQSALSDTTFHLDTETVQRIAQQCNAKAKAARQILENAQHLFLSCYLDSVQQYDAVVVGIQEGAFDVIVLPLLLERRIHTIHLPLKSDTFDSNENKLHLIWQTSQQQTSTTNQKRQSICQKQEEDVLFPEEARQVIAPFDVVKVIVESYPVRNPPLIRVLARNPFE